MRFENKVVLITGGTRGIGFSTARLFAAEGARAVIVGRDKDRTMEAARQVPGRGEAGDVSIAVDCERIVAQTLNLYHRLDVLVNCAGVIFRNRTIETTSEEEWDRTFDVNVKGTFLMSKYALHALRETRGCIVNVSSYVGMVGFAGASAYAASKAAILNLTRSMALDHAKEGIRVNAVCPGSVDTDMIHAAWQQFGDVEQARKLWAGKHPLRRIATPQEVGHAILFLASEEASFITGVALPVDGGITAG
jgi:meso-butanediol dehydrogenase / (S,S)-butanediol dehydrogenase / diacetyl reductase